MQITVSTEAQRPHLTFENNIADLTSKNADISICGNPVCACKIVHFNLQEPEKMDIPVNVFQQELDYSNDKEIPPREKKAAHALVNALSKKNYAELQQLYLSYKIHVTETANLDELVAYFPHEKIQSQGTMIGFHEILPYGKRFSLTIDDQHYEIEDDYCPRPGCGCTNTVFRIVHIDDSHTKEVDTFTVDYKKRKWERIHNGQGLKNIQLRTLLEEKYPSLYNKIGQHHETLRHLYRGYLKRHHPSELPSTVRNPTQKVGRNDPCPCGSGKKYKKCCL